MARPAAEIAIAAAIGCGGSASPPAPQTTIAPAAVPILDAWATAIGGRDRLAKLDLVHRTGTIVRNGLPGRYEKWVAPHGMRVELVFDGFSELHVFDGTRGWFRDRTGQVRELDGLELESERSALFWSRYAALLPDRLPGEVRANADGTLVIAPRDNRHAETVEFDPASHLPRRVREPSQATEMVWALEDYREVDGVRFAFRDRVTIGDDFDETWQALAIDHAPPPPFDRPPSRPAPRLAAPVVVAYEPMRGGVPLVAVTVDGTPLSFVFDTAGYSWIAEARREAIAPGAPGDRELPHRTLAIGELVLTEHVLDTKTFSRMEHYFGRRIDGTLGYDVMAPFVVEIDPTAKTIAFHDRETYRHSPAGAIPITLEAGVPWLDASVDTARRHGVAGRFGIDTACDCGVLLEAPFTRINDLLAGIDPVPAKGIRALWAEIAALHVGDKRIDRPAAVFGVEHFGDLNDPEIAGFLGASVLSRFRVVLDYAHKRIWLDPLVSAASD